MGDLMENRFKRDFNSLDKVFEFISGFTEKYKIDESAAYAINVAVEEIFTNMIKYNSAGREDIAISFEKSKKAVLICLTDFDSDHFDVTKAGAPDINIPLGERKAGGLGLHLVKNLVDNISYEYKDRVSKIKMTKNLEK